MSELENRLAGLDTLAAGPLPGAAAARSRGEQRTRRTRAALAGAGGLVAVLAVTAGVALGGGGPDRVVLPPAEPGPSAPAEVGLSALLLEPEVVSGVRGGEAWEVRENDDFPFDPLPSGCADAAEVFGSPTETALRFLDGPETVDGPQTVGHSLKAYAAQAQAQAAFERVDRAIRACGQTSDGPQVVAGEPASTTTRTYGTLSTGDRTVVFAIERIEAVLSGVAIVSFELNDIVPLAEAAAAAVAGGSSAARSPAPDPGAESRDAGRGLLRPEDVATVEPGDWTQADAEVRGLSPCGARPEGSPADSAGVALRVLREAGGTDVDTQVHRYRSEDDAAAALDRYRAELRSCAAEPGGSSLPGSERSYKLVDDREGRLLVQVITTCTECLPDIAWAAVAQVGDGVVVLFVAVGEDGGPPRELVEEYLAVAEDRLATVAGTD